MSPNRLSPAANLPSHGAQLPRSSSGEPLTRPLLVATDLDGTVISHSQSHSASGTISERTVAAFKHAYELGVQVAFVTGRPMRWLSGLADTLGQSGLVICSNGAVIYDTVNDTIVEAHPIASNTVDQVYEQIHSMAPQATFAMETLNGYISADQYAEVRRNDPHGLRSGVVKLMANIPDAEPDEMLAAARKRLGSMVSVTHSVPGIALLEMSRPDVNKATTLADYTNSLGIGADEVVAFGDMLNDMEMITWAGTGYAVSSGHPDLIARADALAGACDDDGVAIALEHLLDLPE